MSLKAIGDAARDLRVAGEQGFEPKFELRVVTDEDRAADRAAYDAHVAEFNAQANADRRRRYLESLKKRSGLGARFATRTFATWQRKTATDEAYLAAVDAAERNPALWLYGPPRRGKTHLAAAIANAMLEQGVPTAFTTGIDLLDQIRQALDAPRARGDVDVLRDFIEADALVLDDLGKERFTPWVAERLYALTNRRFEGVEGKPNLPVIVTSNVHPNELAGLWTRNDLDRAMGESIVGRLLEMAEGNVVAV